MSTSDPSWVNELPGSNPYNLHCNGHRTTLPFISVRDDRPSQEFEVSPPSPDGIDTGGRYRIDREIARGGMGSVYRGWDTAFEREVAIKLLLEKHLGKFELRRRFVAEGRITARLQHPGIVTVYEAGEFLGGRPFYAMRFIDGRTLEDSLQVQALDRNEYQSTSHLKVFEKVCEAMAYAHTHGVIHRDLKPANIMVGAFGIVKVMDWGVAKIRLNSPFYEPPGEVKQSFPLATSETAAECDSDLQTKYGKVFGTPAYMSPEQALGDIDVLEAPTDVFGLGGILCAILTGLPPYTGASGWLIYEKAVHADLKDAFARLAGCGAKSELIALCQRCLAPNPSDRPCDASALSAELAEYLNYDLRRSERDLARFFELSPDLFCIAGLNGYFYRVNENFSRVLGYTAEELLSRPFVEFVHPDDRSRTLEALDDLGKGWPCTRFRNRYADVRGEYQWFEWTAKSIPEQGIVFAVARNVTDLVQLENQADSFGGN